MENVIERGGLAATIVHRCISIRADEDLISAPDRGGSDYP
jgi:hypothetical protein